MDLSLNLGSEFGTGHDDDDGDGEENLGESGLAIGRLTARNVVDKVLIIEINYL